MIKNDWKLFCAKLAMAVGFSGFAVCWMIGWNTEIRVFGDPAYAEQTEFRPNAVEVKGGIYYLEALYASQYNNAMRWIVPLMSVGGLGGAFFEYRRRKGDKK